MFIDALGLLSDAQALTATAFSTNTIDFGNVTPKRDVASGEPLCVAIQVDVSADATTGDETYRFDVVQSANANLSSPDILITTDTGFITRALLVAGFKFYLALPEGIITKRYFGMQYTLAGTTPLITVTAELQSLSMVQTDKTYAKGYTIS